VLVSHRFHNPPSLGVSLQLDRAVFPGWVFRRALFHGVVQDERLTTTTLGRGAPVGRSRLIVALEGPATVFVSPFPSGPCRTVEMAPGDALVVRDLGALAIRAGDGLSLELDWEPSCELAAGSVPELSHARLAHSTRRALASMSTAMREMTAQDHGRFDTTAAAAIGALRAEGLPLSVGVLLNPEVFSMNDDGQRLIEACDAELCHLEAGPMLWGVEQRLGCSRRTIARRIREANSQYGISAMSGENWRSARDFYRVLLGTILASSRAATTEKLAAVLGYSSPTALCHAFADAGLASPAVVGEQARRG
jgi:AraC-like DNA-binding protein